jgi:hypothetical protein
MFAIARFRPAVKDLRVALLASARAHELGCLRLSGDRKKNKKQVSGTNKFTNHLRQSLFLGLLIFRFDRLRSPVLHGFKV